jgi:manganese oxidase
MTIVSKRVAEKMTRFAVGSILCFSVQLFAVNLQEKAIADVGLGEEQAAEKLELQKMKTELNDVKSITNDAVQELNKINTSSLNQEAKEYHLICRDAQVEILPGVKVNCLSYNGRVPGPVIKAKEGEMVRVILHNQMQLPTSLHFHGMALPQSVDALPRREGGIVHPGDIYTYQFVAPAPGVYWYEPQIVHADQKTRGLYGPIIVEPKEQAESPQADKEFVIVVSDLYAIVSDTAHRVTGRTVGAGAGASPGAPAGAGGAPEGGGGRLNGGSVYAAVSPHKFQIYTGEKHIFYLINGQSAPAIPPMEVSKGMKVRLQLINAGQSAVPLHLSGHLFEPVSGAGEVTAANRDTVNLVPGSTCVVEFTADNPGVWSLASELFEQATNEGRFPGGIACVLRYVDNSAKQ